MLKNYIELLRIRWWVKNLFIFLPLFFAGCINESIVLQVAVGFLSFSLFTSFSYIINDIQDVHIDRHHPRKKNRPIASHAIKIGTALRIAFSCLFIGMALSFLLPVHFLWLSGLYVILNILYSVGLKRMAIINLFIPAIGYVIRIYAGGLIAGIPLSMWLVIITFLLALLFALLHRREDVLMFVDEHAELNRAVRGYSLEFLNITLSIAAAAFVVCYIMFCTSLEIMIPFNFGWICISGLLVIAGLLRYLQLVIVQHRSPEPAELIFKDVWLLLIIITWVAFFVYIIYLK